MIILEYLFGFFIFILKIFYFFRERDAIGDFESHKKKFVEQKKNRNNKKGEDTALESIYSELLINQTDEKRVLEKWKERYLLLSKEYQNSLFYFGEIDLKENNFDQSLFSSQKNLFEENYNSYHSYLINLPLIFEDYIGKNKKNKKNKKK